MKKVIILFVLILSTFHLYAESVNIKFFLQTGEILEKEIGYNGDKGNLPKFLDYLTNYNDYEKYFSIVND